MVSNCSRPFRVEEVDNNSMAVTKMSYLIIQIELKRLEASTGDESLPTFAQQLLEEKNEEIDHLNLQVKPECSRIFI